MLRLVSEGLQRMWAQCGGQAPWGQISCPIYLKTRTVRDQGLLSRQWMLLLIAELEKDFIAAHCCRWWVGGGVDGQ